MSAVISTSNLTSIFRNFVKFARLEEAGSFFITRRHIPKDNNFEFSNLSVSFNLVWSGGGGSSQKYQNTILYKSNTIIIIIIIIIIIMWNVR